MKRALVAATVYFVLLFALGFILGTIRVVVLVPRVGPLAATAAEAPIMLMVAVFACRWVVRRWQVPGETEVRLAMATAFFVLLLTFEAALGLILFGRTPAAQVAAFATPAGLLGLATQLVAALMPLWIRRGQAE